MKDEMCSYVRHNFLHSSRKMKSTDMEVKVPRNCLVIISGYQSNSTR